MKTIFRNNQKNGNFTCISNSILQSETLSPDEIGVLVRFLSLPEDFVINKTSIWKTMNIGREHFHRVWNKLVAAGYIQTTKTIDTKSKHFEYTHSVHEISVHQKFNSGSTVSQSTVNLIPVHQEPVNGKLESLIINNKKEPEKKQEEKTKVEKETGESGSSTGTQSTGPKKDIVEGTPTFSNNCSKSNEKTSTSNNPVLASPLSVIDKKTSINDIKKQKILNLDFLKEVRNDIAFMDYEELVEHINGEFQDFFGPLSQFEQYQLGVIVNGL
jgi:hypothetical protein